ncbi:hypothetical protein [Thalassobius sp. MITS945101]|uniref:hypothetical protein n=1 Tax=Thalassobius sp. MITS945101 TaxID=3096994 RepID=UPI00399C00C7
MKKIAFAAFSAALIASPSLAGNVEAVRIEPEVIEAAAAASSADGMIIMGIMITIVLLAALSTSTGSSYSMY